MRIPFPKAMAASLLGLLGALVYWAGVGGAFFFDDGPSILQAPGIRMTELSWESLRQAWYSGGAGPTGRPIAQLSFAFNHYFSGFNPHAFKLTNLAIHGLCTLLVYLVARRLFERLPGLTSPQGAAWGAVAVAGLWLLHPLQLLPVLHVVQRMSSLSALWLLAAFWLHMLGRAQAGPKGAVYLLLAWGLAWPLSILSKESGALLPVFVLSWELLIRKPAVGRLDGFARIYLILLTLVVLSALFYLGTPRSAWLWSGYEFRPFTLTQRLWTEARVLWFYVGLALLPRGPAFGIYHDDIALSTDWLTPATTLPAVLGWGAVLVLVWRLRRPAPLVAFGLSWFLAGHLLESTILPLEIAHEHRNYLPLLGLLIAAAAGLSQALAWGWMKPRSAGLITAFALLYLAATTAVRAHQFGDELRRSLLEAQYHPASARAQLAAGVALASVPEAAVAGSTAYTMARASLEQATHLDPDLKMPLAELIALDCRAGRGVHQAAWKELARRLRETVFAPGDRNVLYYLKEEAIAGQSCLPRPDVEALFQAAVDNPRVRSGVRAMLYSWRADYLWLRERDLAAAKVALATSLALSPAEPSNRLKWAQLQWLDGQHQDARQLLLALRHEMLSAEERATLEELLAAGNISKP